MRLENYLEGRWIAGAGEGVPLIDPVNGEELARAGSEGLDLAAALRYARERGGPVLRAMSYAERAVMLGEVAGVLGQNRERYYEIARRNSGNTLSDAAMDIEGGIGTLKYYAAVGKSLGDARYLMEPSLERLGRDAAFQAGHIWTPTNGVALHINAFNFPSWGLWEKAAVALLAGVALCAKPATATALLSHEMVRDVVAAGILPDGALSLVCGGGHDLLDHLEASDAVAFTGSADTAARLRTHPRIISRNVRLTVEADSLNAALLGPDVSPGSELFSRFVREVVQEMTVKAGQKCTAIRRILAPADRLEALGEALAEALSSVVVGDPRNEAVDMGPLVNRAQQRAAWEGIERLQEEARPLFGGERRFELMDADPERGCFVPPTLLRCDEPEGAETVHEVEVFGPVATLMPYRDVDQALALVERGGGSLVVSLFTGDDALAAEAAVRLGASHGRILVVDDPVAESHTGHGVVMPQCIHGGPGRAGGGEELGGLRGLRLYHQRSAVQASVGRLETLKKGAAEIVL
ncbi:MAG: hypothetical protein Kow006_14870 [Gammaproteobacteria bacterium]